MDGEQDYEMVMRCRGHSVVYRYGMTSNTADGQAVIRSDMATCMQVSAMIVPKGRLIMV